MLFVVFNICVRISHFVFHKCFFLPIHLIAPVHSNRVWFIVATLYNPITICFIKISQSLDSIRLNFNIRVIKLLPEFSICLTFCNFLNICVIQLKLLIVAEQLIVFVINKHHCKTNYGSRYHFSLKNFSYAAYPIFVL